MKSADFQLNENAGSKPLANKYLALTQEAQDLSCEIGRALEPIFTKAYKAGFSPRDVSDSSK